jgi:hypothetical protein
MREWRVAHIVKQRGGARGESIFYIDLIAVAETIEDARDQMCRTETVRKARVLGALVRVKAKAQLFDSTKTLKFWGVDQPNY